MHRTAVPVIVLAAVLLGTPAPASAQTCTGDLDLDGDVEVTEVVYLARCALHTAVVQCPPEEVAVDTIIAAVNNALLGCGDRVWMVTVPCRQCEPCRFGDDRVLLRGLPGFDAALVAALLPEGVVPLGHRIVWPEAVCYACGCPGGPIVYVRVSREDVPTLRTAGWWLDSY